MRAQTVPVETHRLLAMFMHEFQTPLTSIKGYAQLLQRGSVSNLDDAKNCAAVIVQQTNVAVRVLQDALLAVGVGSGTIDLTLEPVPIRLVVEQVIECLRPEDRARVRYDLAPHLRVRADRRCLEASVVNLLCSIVKYACDDDAITISSEILGGKVSVRMRLDGQGIAETKWRSVLGEGSSTDEDLIGSGLGFYLARLLVEAHGETLEVLTEGGRGREFAFCLSRYEGLVEVSERWI